ncbi:MAG: hypothetical protein PHN80_00885 [Hespellia sp.]|nr:hypothetical protein [Hespellia sp.]
MNLSTTMAECLQNCASLWIVQLTSILFFLIYVGKLVPPKRPQWIMFLFATVKFFVQITLFNIILGAYFKETVWWKLTHFTMVVVFAVLSCFVFLYVYSGDWLHVLIASIISEAIASCTTGLGIMGANLLSGEQEIWSVVAPFRPAFFLIPVIAWSIGAVLYHLVKPILGRYRSYQFKHPVVLWSFFFLYLFYAFLSNLPNAVSDNETFYRVNYGVILTGSLLPAGFYVLLIWRRKKRTEMERMYLKKMQVITELQYKQMHSQILYMKESQKKMQLEMHTLLQLKEEKGADDRIRDYISKLERHYHAIKAGVYSDDWQLDALLCHYAGICQSQEIAVDFSTQGLAGQQIGQYMGQILLELLEFGVHHAIEGTKQQRHIKLHIAIVRNQLVIDMIYSGAAKYRPGKTVKDWKRTSQGAIMQTRTNGSTQLLLCAPL